MTETAVLYLLVKCLIHGLAEEDVIPDSAERAPRRLGNVGVGAASMGSAGDDVELAEDGLEERRLAHSDGAGNDGERALQDRQT